MKKETAKNVVAAEKETKQKPNYFTVRIPHFISKTSPVNAFLIFTLIIFAFLLGMLTNKVIYLQQLNKTLQETPPTQAADAGPTVPPPPAVVKDMKVGKLPILGNKDAKVTVVEFSDFQCPFCERFFTETEKQLDDMYIKTGKIKLAYRHYPLVSIHPNAQKAGEASECANAQGKFWEYHNLLFQNQAAWSVRGTPDVFDDFTDLAGQLSLDTAQFRSCLENDQFKQNVDDDTAAGNAAQVDGTPTFFINGVRVVGAVPFADIQKVIDEELKK